MPRRPFVVRRGCSFTEPVLALNQPAAFLDRDGVLNVDHGYVSQVRDFEWIPGAKSAIQWLRKQGFAVVVVTNQSAVARGLATEDDVVALAEHMRHEVAFDGYFYCPHGPESDCPGRKPNPGMLQVATETLGLVQAGSFLIGDRDRDIAAASAFGIPGHLFAGGDLNAFVRSVV